MGFISVLSCAHQWIAARLHSGDYAIDATLGTGSDALFLAQTVGAKGHIYGFDIQEEAIRLSSAKLNNAANMNKLAPFSLFCCSHADMKEIIPTDKHGQIGAVMFNLGYLPVEHADHSVITETTSTITALTAALELLRPKGILTVVLYPGHQGGDEEATSVSKWASQLPTDVGQAVIYRQLQRETAPYLIAIEKK
ncbi:class I SAM-dependent methyltransferase [Paenibacillus shunpengii]|uniref:Class I SAM-dependent methyltransferase n=1 Tax=Paenibacillus shunpengii TaxID=2054424 RepID=A0ABW5SM47_9BACL|nr:MULTISPECIES: class I SAM-dependent methyltransferase [unclassified Paenibacillus]OMC71621.1 SAM-dependent methyltransferase [Paenibacillus sp. FSL H7-0326]SDW32732.1 Putative rRNA methylase [Paenibacillus sp. PDC88]